jgi:hypothetical protein
MPATPARRLAVLHRRPEVARRALPPRLALLGRLVPGVLVHLLRSRLAAGIELLRVLVLGAATAAPDEVVDRARADGSEAQHDQLLTQIIRQCIGALLLVGDWQFRLSVVGVSM